MLSRLLQFLLLVLVAIQSPAARACDVGAFVSPGSCHGQRAADAAVERPLVHCDEASFGDALAGLQDRPACQACQVRPLTTEQKDRGSLPVVAPLPAPLLSPPLGASATPTSRYGRLPSFARTAPAAARVLPLLI